MNLEFFTVSEVSSISQPIGVYSCYSATSTGQALQTLGAVWNPSGHPSKPLLLLAALRDWHGAWGSCRALEMGQIEQCKCWAGPPSWERRRKPVTHFIHPTGTEMGKAESKRHLCFVWSCQNLTGVVPNCFFPLLVCRFPLSALPGVAEVVLLLIPPALWHKPQQPDGRHLKLASPTSRPQTAKTGGNTNRY